MDRRIAGPVSTTAPRAEQALMRASALSSLDVTVSTDANSFNEPHQLLRS